MSVNRTTCSDIFTEEADSNCVFNVSWRMLKKFNYFVHDKRFTLNFGMHGDAICWFLKVPCRTLKICEDLNYEFVHFILNDTTRELTLVEKVQSKHLVELLSCYYYFFTLDPTSLSSSTWYNHRIKGQIAFVFTRGPQKQKKVVNPFDIYGLSNFNVACSFDFSELYVTINFFFDGSFIKIYVDGTYIIECVSLFQLYILYRVLYYMLCSYYYVHQYDKCTIVRGRQYVRGCVSDRKLLRRERGRRQLTNI